MAALALVALAALLCTAAKAQISPLERAIKESSVGPENEPRANVFAIERIILAYPSSDLYEGQALLLLGKEQFRSEDFTKAATTTGQALKLLPPGSRDAEKATTIRLESFSHLDRYAEAAKEAQRLLETCDPVKSRDSFEYAGRRRYEELIAQARVTKSPVDIRAAHEALQSYISFGDRDDARGWRTVGGVYREARMLMACDRNQEAAIVLRTFVDRHPTSQFAAEMAVDIVMLEKHRTVATIRSEDIRWIPDKYPCNSSPGMGVIYEIAHTLHRDGRPRDAIAYAQQVLDFSYSDRSTGDHLSGTTQENAARLIMTSYDELGNRKAAISSALATISRFPDTEVAEDAAALLKKFGINALRSKNRGDHTLSAMVLYGIAALLLIVSVAIIKARKVANPA